MHLGGGCTINTPENHLSGSWFQHQYGGHGRNTPASHSSYGGATAGGSTSGIMTAYIASCLFLVTCPASRGGFCRKWGPGKVMGTGISQFLLAHHLATQKYIQQGGLSHVSDVRPLSVGSAPSRGETAAIIVFGFRRHEVVKPTHHPLPQPPAAREGDGYRY